MFNKLFFLIGLITLLAGCLPDSLDKWDVENGGAQGSTDGPSTLANTSTAQMILADVTQEVGGMSTDLSHKLHAQGTVSGACEIQSVGSPGEPVEELCWLDAEELDLHFWGMDLRFYASQDACDYIGYEAYTFYNFQPGQTSFRGITVYNFTDGCGIADTTVGVFNATNLAVDNSITAPIPPYCYYNHGEKGGNDSPNCDAGILDYYTVSVGHNDATPPACVESDPVKVERDCGNNGHATWFNCLEGPGKDSDNAGFIYGNNDDGNGFVIPREKVWEGDNEDHDFEYQHPTDTQFRNNVYLANYSRFCSDGTNVNQYNTEGARGYSSFQNTLDLTPDNPTYILEKGAGPRSDRTNHFYKWTCYDKAMDVKAIIRLVVRDWNVRFDPNADYLKLAYPGSDIMDRVGAEKVGLDHNWYDKDDWDDLWNSGITPISTNCSSAVRVNSIPGNYYLQYPRQNGGGEL